MRRTLLGIGIVFVGCSSNSTPTANAYVESSFQASEDLGTPACGVAPGTWVDVGNSDQPADDGSSQGGYNVSVSCAVTSNSDGSFQVNAEATDGNSGSVTVIGKFTTSGTQTGITGIFTRGDTGSFRSSNCTVTYTGNQGVAAGRVWGDIDCPDVVNMGATEIGPDGGDVQQTCHALGEFKFQNCSQ